jgi:hypothetical protein
MRSYHEPFVNRKADPHYITRVKKKKCIIMSNPNNIDYKRVRELIDYYAKHEIKNAKYFNYQSIGKENQLLLKNFKEFSQLFHKVLNGKNSTNKSNTNNSKKKQHMVNFLFDINSGNKLLNHNEKQKIENLMKKYINETKSPTTPLTDKELESIPLGIKNKAKKIVKRFGGQMPVRKVLEYIMNKSQVVSEPPKEQNLKTMNKFMRNNVEPAFNKKENIYYNAHSELQSYPLLDELPNKNKLVRERK